MSDSLPHIFRSRLGLITTRLSIAVILALTVFGIWRRPGGEAFDSIWNVAIPLLSLMASTLLFLLGRPLAIATPETLVVRNLVRTHRLAWAQIIAVRFGRDAPWVVLDLSDGSTLPVLAIAASDGQRARRASKTLATFVEKYSR